MTDNVGNFSSTQPWTPAVSGTATQSNGVFGTTDSDKDSAVYGAHTGNGIGVFGRGGKSAGQGVFGQTDTSTAAVHGENTANGAGTVGISADGYGVLGQSGSGFAMRAEGPVSQARGAGGWAKALVQVSKPFGQQVCSIARSFNSQPGIAAPTLYRLDFGIYSIDFHFDISDRYVPVTATGLSYQDQDGIMTYPRDPYAPLWYPPPSGNTYQDHLIVANVIFDGLTGPPTPALGDPGTRVPVKTMLTVMTYQPVIIGAAGGYVMTGFQLHDAGYTVAVF